MDKEEIRELIEEDTEILRRGVYKRFKELFEIDFVNIGKYRPKMLSGKLTERDDG